MRKKTTGVIGCGWFGEAHCRVLSSISDLVAVCDIDTDKARRVGQKYGIRWYNQHQDMLKEERLEAVSVATSPNKLSKIASDCAKAAPAPALPCVASPRTASVWSGPFHYTQNSWKRSRCCVTPTSDAASCTIYVTDAARPPVYAKSG